MVEIPGLEKEYQFFEEHRAEWAQNHQGEFVLIQGGKKEGFYPSYDDAYRAGLSLCGVQGNFLIQQVCTVQPVFVVY